MWVEVADYSEQGWAVPAGGDTRARWYCEQLEQGQVLFFARPPFVLPEADREFLVGLRQSDSRLHKNISYRPGQDLLRGFSDGKQQQQRVRQILRQYSAQVVAFVSRFLAPYAGQLLLDFASFRPLEEKGRDLPLHKRNDLLHVDAFPSRPTRGGRILRVFTNLNPVQGRVWLTTERFPALAKKYAAQAGLRIIAAGGACSLRGRLTRLLHAGGLPLVERSPYDQFMLRFHDFLKEHSAFQQGCEKIRSEFPPLATWLVFTDGVPHAVLSGQFALEQTFIVPVRALVAPQHAPIRVLEKICGKSLEA